MCCAGILRWVVDMSPGISAARAQVSLNDLYEHPHSTAGNTHTHKHSKINTADGTCALFLLNFLCFFFRSTLDTCKGLWSAIGNTSRVFLSKVSVRLLLSLQSRRSALNAKCRVECLSSRNKGRNRLEKQIKADFSSSLLPRSSLFLPRSPPPSAPSLPTVALEWRGSPGGGRWPACIQRLHRRSIITPANQSTLQQRLCSSAPPPHSPLTLCLSVCPPLRSSY